MKLSIVSTLYRSAESIEEFHARASAAAKKLAGDDYEIVYVNDGSPDDSLARVLRILQTDPHVVAVDLSRNFGHHKAMMTGLGHARGELVFLIDSDLEEEPGWLAQFHETLQSSGADVVFGVQDRRKGAALERWSGTAFYWMINRATRLDLPQNVVTARLMTRRYVDALLKHREREVFILGLWHTTGFTQTPYVVRKDSRGETTYDWRRKIAIVIDSVTSFSNAPLILIFNVGIVISMLALGYIVWLVINRVFLSTPLSGWTSLMASIWFLNGLVISFIGIIGVYLSKIFSETKQRPYTIVREVHGRSDL